MKRSVILAVGIQFGAPCLGIALGWWLLVGWMIPRLGLGEVDRIRQLGQHIQQHIERLEQPLHGVHGGNSDESGLAVLLGDSITREGVDTELLEQSRTDVSDLVFENWAVSGCSLAEQRVQLSLALRAKPRLVVFALGPSSLCQLQDMPLDKAFAYAYSGFIETRAWGDILPPGCGLTESALEALNSTRWRQQLHFRTAPKSWLNQRLRGAVRGGGLEQVAGDWRSPHVMSGSVGAKQLDWHLKLVE
ncbi:MAG: hypothetical protein KDB14_09845, partial [Planctomycetales bacterium]|nr:hypothetical protein [Planctomycetales bacterium]